jgi:hypothetical protein
LGYQQIQALNQIGILADSIFKPGWDTSRFNL